ncbi:MAG: class I SAM-dependent methyltransferase [Nitrospinae bacterium]|nr:class I SAM-dependent methyltransferase [Nitrospinota bacterium]
MTERETIDQKAREFMDSLWGRGDPWDIENSEYEQARCARLLKLLEGRRYARALEIGCGAGYLTRFLARVADQIVALDISPVAITRAQTLWAGPEVVDFRVANIMEYKPSADGPWDLIVFSDTICYLGWLYPFFDVAWLAAALFHATRGGGRLLLANSMYEGEDLLLLPYIIRTYRDLFLNVGYQPEAEETFRGTKNSIRFEVLISLFGKGPEGV